MATKSTNEMILSTLRTKTDTEPRYSAELAAAGYSILDKEHSAQGYWSVCYGEYYLTISKNMGNETSLYLNSWTNIVSGFDRVKRVDFENVLSTGVERRTARANAPKDPYPVEFYTHRDYWGHRERRYHCRNRNVDEYMRLKKASEDTAYEQRKVDEAKQALERAQREYQRALEDLEKKQAKCSAAGADLAGFLKDKGIR